MKKKLDQATQAMHTGGTNFLVSVYHQENHSWQGSIQWLDTGEKIHFRSELELLSLMHTAIQANYEEQEKHRIWNNDKNIGVS